MAHYSSCQWAGFTLRDIPEEVWALFRMTARQIREDGHHALTHELRAEHSVFLQSFLDELVYLPCLCVHWS